MFTEQDLAQFYGTSQYYRDGMTKAFYTDGIHHIEQNGASWLVSDALIILKMVEAVKSQPFVAISATPQTDTENAAVTYTDGNGNELYKQEYMASDLPCEVKMFFTDNVLMLQREY